MTRREARADFEAHDPEARQRDGETRFLCPFPSCAAQQDPRVHRTLSYNERSGLWHCHRCDAKGMDPAFWAQPPAASTGYKSPKDRKREVLRRAFAVPAPKSLEVPTVAVRAVDGPETAQSPVPAWRLCLGSHVPLMDTPGAVYLEGRGLPADFCADAGVRFSPDYYGDKSRGNPGRPAVVFPLMDEGGRAVAAQGRHIRDDVPRKALTTRGGTNGGLFDTIGAFEGPVLVIVEAPIDALTLALCGLPAVATCGASNFPLRLKRAALNRIVVLAHDADDAGNKAAGRITDALALAAPLAVLRLRPQAAKDWNEQMQRDGADALTEFLSTFVAANVERLLPLASDAPCMPVAMLTDATGIKPPDAPPACPFGDVPPYPEPAALLAFVIAAHWGTGLDIRAMDGRVVLVEKGRVVGVWAGPASGRLALGSDYWRPAESFTFQLFGAE